MLAEQAEPSVQAEIANRPEKFTCSPVPIASHRQSRPPPKQKKIAKGAQKPHSKMYHPSRAREFTKTDRLLLGHLLVESIRQSMPLSRQFFQLAGVRLARREEEVYGYYRGLAGQFRTRSRVARELLGEEGGEGGSRDARRLRAGRGGGKDGTETSGWCSAADGVVSGRQKPVTAVVDTGSSQSREREGAGLSMAGLSPEWMGIDWEEELQIEDYLEEDCLLGGDEYGCLVGGDEYYCGQEGGCECT